MSDTGTLDTGQKQFPLCSLSKTDQQILLENKMTEWRSEWIKELEKRFDLLPWQHRQSPLALKNTFTFICCSLKVGPERESDICGPASTSSSFSSSSVYWWLLLLFPVGRVVHGDWAQWPVIHSNCSSLQGVLSLLNTQISSHITVHHYGSRMDVLMYSLKKF